MTNLQSYASLSALIAALAASAFPAPAEAAAPRSSCAVPTADAKLLTAEPIERPRLAEIEHESGTAVVRIDLSENGAPQRATIVRSTGYIVLDQAAQAAALHQKYSAERRNCDAVAGSYLVSVEYPQ